MANPADNLPVSTPPAVQAVVVASAPSGPKKKFNPWWVILPLMAVVLIGVGVAWEMFRARMEALQQGQGGEGRLGGNGPAVDPHDRRSREIKVPGAPAEVTPTAEDDDLVGLGKKKKPPPPPKPAAATNPTERAWRSVKGEFDRLEARNESTAHKYRIRILSLDGARTNTPEASFLKQAGSLEEELRVELSKPENQ